LDCKAFWRHAVGVGFASRANSKKLQQEAESAFLASILHDVGKIVLGRYFGDFYAEVINIVGDGETSIYTAEQDVMGITRAEIGGVLAGEWKFANNYLNTIIYHHKPQDAALDQFSMQERGLQMLVEAVEEELEGADSFLMALSS
tara:strand:- start:740 stop:1174 length:435 start_codon:yes stop_codon:yes gene_type:complete